MDYKKPNTTKQTEGHKIKQLRLISRMGKGKYKRLSCSLGLEKKHKDGILPRKNKGVYLQMFAVIPSVKEKQHERKTFYAYWPFSYSACERKVGARNASSVPLGMLCELC